MFSDFFMIWLAKELRPFRALELWVNSIPRALPLGYRLLHRWCVRETKNQELVQTFANFADLAVKKNLPTFSLCWVDQRTAFFEACGLAL
jgi:hypothetical protein